MLLGDQAVPGGEAHNVLTPLGGFEQLFAPMLRVDAQRLEDGLGAVAHLPALICAL